MEKEGIFSTCVQEYRYHDMHSPMLEDPDFDGKPLVMLIGQYSTGKTTFIRCHFFRPYVEPHFSTI